MQTKNINIKVELDNQHIPSSIEWTADDLEGMDRASCRAMLLSLWDNQSKDTLKLDLWTRDMTVDEMKIFFHQTLVSMADTLDQAINDDRISGDMRDFCDYFFTALAWRENRYLSLVSGDYGAFWCLYCHRN